MESVLTPSQRPSLPLRAPQPQAVDHRFGDQQELPAVFKVLHLLRHGIAVHNQPNGQDLPPASLLDACLTAQGVAQAHAARHTIQALQPQFVITSPLTRALQTTTIIMSPENAGVGNEDNNRTEGKSTRIVAVELVREAYGVLLPDKRRNATELQAAFRPTVDFSLLSEEDQLWTASQRESLESVRGRARKFLHELLPRPERHVLLVSHGVFLQCLLQETLLLDDPSNSEWNEGQQIMNCELYTVIFVAVDPLCTGGSNFSSPPSASLPGQAYSPSAPADHNEPNLSGQRNPPLLPMLASGGGKDRLVRRLLLSPGVHDMLVGADLGPSFMDNVVGWLAELFLAYTHGQYQVPVPAFTRLMGLCGVEEAFVCERYFVAFASRRRPQAEWRAPARHVTCTNVPQHQNAMAEGRAIGVPSTLTFEDFLVGLVAMEPGTANTGQWRRLRAEYIFRAYDLNDDGDLAFEDFKLVVEDMARLHQGKDSAPGWRCDPQVLEKEARKWHKGGRCSLVDFVSAVETMKFQGTGVLFRTPQSVIHVDKARRRLLLDGSRTPSSASPSSSGPSSGGCRDGARTSTSCSTGKEEDSDGLCAHVGQASSSVVKVNSRQICFDVSKQRYSMSPHEKTNRKLVRIHEDHAFLSHQEGRRASGGREGDESSCDEVDRQLARTGMNSTYDSHRNGEQYEKDFRTMSAGQETAHRIIRLLLDWDPNRQEALPERGVFEALKGLSDLEPLFEELQSLLATEPTVLEVRTPTRIFGDIHGQLNDLLRLFKAYGRPDRFGDINLVDYIFNGDFVDRGPCSCDVVLLLFAIKVAYPRRVYLIRGNHESRAVNALFGFKTECVRRLGEQAGVLLWEMCNSLFDVLPLAACVEGRILVLHGGLGASLNSLEQLRNLRRPIYDGQSAEEPLGQLLRDILWSDPTASDVVRGTHASPRGAGIALFGPDRVEAFCRANDLDVVIRSHQVVSHGYELFANQRLITVFSATDYCGQHKNDGAILEIDRDLVITPKLVKDDKSSRWSMPRDSSPPRTRVP